MSVPRSITFSLLGLATAVFAQEPAEAPPGAVPPPGVPVPDAVPAPPAGGPAGRPRPIVNPANPVNPAPEAAVPENLGETKITEPIEEPKLSGTALAGLYRKYTGYRVLVPTAAATAEFSFIQDASPNDPLTYATAAALLRKAATLEGFVFVPDEEDPNLFILTANGSIRPTNRGVKVYNENDPLPEGDAVISYVMNLSYIKPAEAVNTFTQIIGQFGAYGSIAPVPNAAAVVITENTSLIRKLIDLKKEIDKPSSQIGTRFIKVQYADVTEIATTLTDLLTAQQAAQKTAGIQRADGGAPAAAAPPGGVPAPGGGEAGGGGSSGEETPVQIIPDPRTNRIFAMGRPVDLLFVEGLVREFDVETSEKNFLRRKLRFLTVADFLPVAGDALTRAFSGTGGEGGSSGGAASAGGAAGGGANRGGSSTQGNQASSRQSGSSRNSNSSSGGGSTNFGGSLSGGGSGGGGSSSSGLSDPNVSSAPQSVLVGRTLLVADNITNSIVVQGPPSGLEIIERLLDQIDVKPDQVMISTVIGQLTLDDSTTFGLNYLSLGGDVIGGGGSAFPGFIPTTTTGTGTGTTTTTNNFPVLDRSSLGGSGLRVYGKIGNNMSVYLQALQKNNDFTVLSRPSIFTSNNQKGTISSGERIAIPTGSTSYGTSNNASTQIEYQDVVLKLEVIPLVNSDNEITMQISLLNDEQNGTQTIQGGAGGGGDLTVPKISTREILTTVTVPNNETIVLGGLIVGRTGKDKSGIPILSSIPYIGGLFGSNTDTKTRSELLVFMQPSVVKNDRSLNSVQSDMDVRYKVSDRTRNFADGPGVLPPIDSIPVEDKASSVSSPSHAYKPTPVAPAAQQSKTMKPSIRPAHRQ